MASARGVVETEVCGKKRRLRLNLEAVDEIETATGEPFPKLAISLGDEQTVRFGHVLVMFEQMCQAGGTPLTEAERSELLPSDLREMVEAVAEACRASGAIEEAKPAKKKRKASSKPRGGSGKNSRSGR